MSLSDSDSNMDIDGDDPVDQNPDTKPTARGLARHPTPPRIDDGSQMSQRGRPEMVDKTPAKAEAEPTARSKIKITPPPPPRFSGFKPSNSLKNKTVTFEKSSESDPKPSCSTQDHTTTPEANTSDMGGLGQGARPKTVIAKNFRCHLCPFTTTTKGYLARHLNKRHPFVSHSTSDKYDPRLNARTPEKRRYDAISHREDNFDFTPKPIIRNMPSDRDSRARQQSRPDEPMSKSPKVEPYVPQHVSRCKPSMPRLIPLDDTNTDRCDPRRQHHNTHPGVATANHRQPRDMVPDSFKHYVQGAIDTKLAEALKSIEETLEAQ